MFPIVSSKYLKVKAAYFDNNKLFIVQLYYLFVLLLRGTGALVLKHHSILYIRYQNDFKVKSNLERTYSAFPSIMSGSLASRDEKFVGMYSQTKKRKDNKNYWYNLCISKSPRLVQKRFKVNNDFLVLYQSYKGLKGFVR